MRDTLAAPEDVVVYLQCESDVPENNTIEVGQTDDKMIMNLNKAAGSDKKLAKIAYSTGSSSDNIRTAAVNAGTVTVAYGTDSGMVSTYRLHITDPANISAYAIKDGGVIQFDRAGGKSKPLPVEIIEGGGINIKWHSTNEAVAKVDNRGWSVTAKSKGISLLIGEFTDKCGVDREIYILVGVGVKINGEAVINNQANGMAQQSGGVPQLYNSEMTGDPDAEYLDPIVEYLDPAQ
jgi:hypothetical protein